MIAHIQRGGFAIGLGICFVQGVVYGAADRGYLQVVGPVPLRYRTATSSEPPTPIPSVMWMDEVDGGWQGPPIPPDYFLSAADKLADLKPKADPAPTTSPTLAAGTSASSVPPAPATSPAPTASVANGAGSPLGGGNVPSVPPVAVLVPALDPGVVIQSFTQDPDAVSARSLVKYFGPVGGTNGVGIMVAPFGFTPPPPAPVPPPSSRAVYTTNPAP